MLNMTTLLINYKLNHHTSYVDVWGIIYQFILKGLDFFISEKK
jgi:hypothetical protein